MIVILDVDQTAVDTMSWDSVLSEWRTHMIFIQGNSRLWLRLRLWTRKCMRA